MKIDLNSQKRKLILFCPPYCLHPHDVQGVSTVYKLCTQRNVRTEGRGETLTYDWCSPPCECVFYFLRAFHNSIQDGARFPIFNTQEKAE